MTSGNYQRRTKSIDQEILLSHPEYTVSIPSTKHLYISLFLLYSSESNPGSDCSDSLHFLVLALSAGLAELRDSYQALLAHPCQAYMGHSDAFGQLDKQ